jgi:hypothetical protein
MWLNFKETEEAKSNVSPIEGAALFHCPRLPSLALESGQEVGDDITGFGTWL